MCQKSKELTVKDITDNFHFISDSQTVKEIKNRFLGTELYDSFFVKIDENNGYFDSIYGMEGIVPHLHKKVYFVL